MQNRWEPWACSPVTWWSHLEVMGESGFQSVLLCQSPPQSHFGCCHCRAPCFTKIKCWKWKWGFQCFCGNLGIFHLDLTPECMEIWCCLKHTFKPSFILWSQTVDPVLVWTKLIHLVYSQSGHRSSPSQFGDLLWEGSNAETILKTKIGDGEPAGRKKALDLSLSKSLLMFETC